MAETFQNILTIVGQQKKAAAEAGGATVNITHFKVGDSNGIYYTPLETQTDLVHTTYTGSFTDNSGSQIIVNPSALNEVLYKCYIPANIGGFTVRELGLFDANNDLILVCKLPVQDKFALDSGLFQPLTFTPKIIYTSPATQAVLTPSSQIIATQTYVTQQLTEITEQVNQLTEEVNGELSGHITDPNAHSSLFAAKANINHNHDERYYTETEINDIISRLFPTICLPCSVSSGNTDANGYPYIINKISDTEVSFLVGGIYNNLDIHDSAGRKYTISSIANVNIPAAQGTYIFIIDFKNLTLLENGTYSAVATAVKLVYSAIENSEVNLLTGFTSNTNGNITVSANYSSGSAYLACDGNDSTQWAGAGHQTLCGNPYPFVPGGGGNVEFYVTFATPVRLWKCTLLQGYTWSGSGTLYLSEDNGTSWIAATGIWGGDGTQTTYTFPQYNNLLVNKAKFVFTGGCSWHSSGGDCGTCGMDTYSLGLYQANLVEYAGGKISEGYTYPEATLSYTPVIPTMTSNNSGGFVASGSSIYGGDYYKPFDGITGDAYPLFVYGSHDYVLDLQFDTAKDNIAAYDIKHWDNYVVGWRLQLYYGGAWHIVDEQTGKNITATTRFYLSSTYSGVTKLRFSTAEPRPGGAFGLDLLQLYQTVSSFPQNGDYHTLINKIPYKPQKKINGFWIDREFVKIGEANKAANGTLGVPRNYAFNRKITIKLAGIVSNHAAYTIDHNLGTDRVKPPYGFFNNITNVGTSATAEVPNGTGGYRIGDGSERYSNLMYRSTLVNTGKNTCILQPGINGLYMSANGGVIASADAEITVEATW